MIPKLIHQVWLGPDDQSASSKVFRLQWQAMYPDWQYTLWTEHELAELEVPASVRPYLYGNYPLTLKSDLVRLLVLYAHGGIYLDTDFEPLRNFQPALEGVEFFVSHQPNGEINNAVLGCTQLHPETFALLEAMVDHIKSCSALQVPWVETSVICGPIFLTQYYERWIKFPDLRPCGVKFFESKLWFPYWYLEPHRRHEDFKTTSPEALAVHHWDSTRRSCARCHKLVNFKPGEAVDTIGLAAP